MEGSIPSYNPVGYRVAEYSTTSTCVERAAASTSHPVGRPTCVPDPIPTDPTRPDAMGLLLLLVGVAVGWLWSMALCAPSAHASAHALAAPALSPAALREQALLRLQEALGLPAPGGGGGEGGGGGRRAEAPEFMLQLQRRVAHPDGVLRARSALPHGAHIVRSFFEQEPFEEHVLRFNVSRLSADERVLGAELRVFRLRRTRAPLLLRVYQVEGGRGAGAGADEHRLLGVQATGARAPPAWHSFNVAAAVRAWLAGDAPNLGLLVTASALDGGPAHAHAPPFARRHRHAPRRQPLLVLYDAEGPAAPPDPNAGPPAFSPPSENEVDEDEEDEYDDEEYAEGDAGAERRGGRARRDAPWSGPRRRRRRHGTSHQQQPAAVNANATGGDGDGGLCARQDLWVEFDEIGWNSWIIAPAGYNAFQCAGACPYPVGPAFNPTNHATVQSIVHALGLQAHARAPCCAPDRLEGLSLLFTNDQNDVVLKIYEDMVASTCACH